MTDKAHNNEENGVTARRSEAVRRGNRTRRLKAANKPFDVLDGEVAELNRRMDLPKGDPRRLDHNIGRVMLSGLKERRELEQAKDRRTETILKLDEVDVRSELEDLKRELGISS